MSKYTTSVIMSAAVSVATFATAHAQQTALTIPDNDSVYVDAKSFQVIPGKGKGDAGPQLRDLAARELGAGAIIIRSGNKLYIAEGQTLRGVVTAYANDPRLYNPALTGGGSVGYNAQFANDPRQYNPALTGGGSVGYNAQFAYDPRQYNPALTGGAASAIINNSSTIRGSRSMIRGSPVAAAPAITPCSCNSSTIRGSRSIIRASPVAAAPAITPCSCNSPTIRTTFNTSSKRRSRIIGSRRLQSDEAASLSCSWERADISFGPPVLSSRT